jgi:hypothetical protein
MKEENMGTRDTINTRGSARSGKIRVIWGSEGISTGDTLTEKQKVELIKIVLKRAGKGNVFDLHTLPAETRFLIETLDNVHIHMFSENFDNSGRDWLIIAADEATARREANKI